MRSKAAWLAVASDHVLTHVVPRLETLGVTFPENLQLRTAVVMALVELHHAGALEALEETERRLHAETRLTGTH